MLNRIIAFSIQNKLIVGIFLLALIGWGVYNVSRLPIDAVPDITNNQVLVITSSPSLGAADIERLVTFPIETATRNIPGIIEQRSFSRFGLSIITIVFNDKTDVYWARQQVSERLLQVQVPPSLGTPVLGPVTTGLGEIFQYVLRPKPGYEGRYDAMELRTIQDWIVRRQLLGTPGVADVSSFGGKLKQFEIGVNSQKLTSYHLTITDVFTALQQNNQNTGGAYIEEGPVVLYIRSEGLVKTTHDIEGIVVKTLPDGTPVFIRDIGEVHLGFATRYGAMCYNDQGEVAGAVVMMLKGENSSKVVTAVKEKITQISKTLPEGVEIEAFIDRTKMVNNAISTVKRNLIEGALIVVFILVVFMGNLRAGLLVASVIPLSMLFAISLMNLFGVSGNLMSLGAIDFGLIVDGAVIIVEAVMHHLHQAKGSPQGDRLNQQEMDGEVQTSASKLMNAAVFGQVIIIIVYMPLLMLEGIEGKMFRPMAQTVVFAIAGAFLLSLTYVPMMSALVLSKKIIRKATLSDRIMDRIGQRYQSILRRALSFPGLLVAISVVLFGIAVFVLSRMGGEFIPTLEEGDFAVDTRVLTGSSLSTTIKATQQAAHILLTRFPEVQKVVTKIGSGEIPTDPMTMDASDMMVILKQKSHWTSAATFDELAEKMSRALAEVPGITAGFEFPVQMRFNELMTGGRQDVICKVFGEDLDSLARFAGLVGNIARRINGACDIYVEAQTGLPQIEVRYNRDALSEYGMSVTDVNNILQSAFAGAVAGQVYEEEKRFDLVVRLNNEHRQSLTDVQNLLVTTSRGAQIPLRQVADVQIRVGPNQIQRENAARRITVGFNVRGRDIESVVRDLQKEIGSHLRLPPGYYLTYGGQFENLAQAKERLKIAVPVSLLLILFMLYMAFQSLSESLLIFSAIPLSAIGGVLALALRGMPFSISAGVGFIALFGIAVLNGIVLLSEFNRLQKSGITDTLQRIREGTSTRLRPVLMTASVASLGFLPMALSNGAGAEVQRPLATVVIGGLLTATLLTLVVLPCLYLLLQRLREGDSTLSRWVRKVKGQGPKASGATLLLLSACIPAFSQQVPVTLPDALSTAMQQNRIVQAAALQTSALRSLEKTAWDIPFTSLQGEWGRINSPANDTRFTVLQQVALPRYYQSQQRVFRSQTEEARLAEKVVRLRLKQEVTRVYYDMLLTREKQRLLLQTDSLLAIYVQRQQQRLEAGDNNRVEAASARLQRLQVTEQLQQAAADFQVLQTDMGYLLGARLPYVPAQMPLKAVLLRVPDSASLAQYPLLQLKKQQQNRILSEISGYQARKLPQLSLGYNNQSFSGPQSLSSGAHVLTGSDRFSSLIAGVSIPLFNHVSRVRVAAGRIQLSVAEKEYADTLAFQQAQVAAAQIRYQKSARTVRFYEEEVLPQAELLEKSASLQLDKGSINFLEWTLLVNQAISTRTAYLNALHDLNRAVLDLNSYSPDF